MRGSRGSGMIIYLGDGWERREEGAGEEGQNGREGVDQGEAGVEGYFE